tara:strand:- start:756 stop:923 length:168 start_codon:yes stop_codon:yes gene_type:complete
LFTGGYQVAHNVLRFFILKIPEVLSQAVVAATQQVSYALTIVAKKVAVVAKLLLA